MTGGVRISTAMRLQLAGVVFVLIAVGLARIVSTYPVFNHTWDEPAHIACGMELLERGTYTLDQLNPPLARIAVALGPYWAGVRSFGNGKQYAAGQAILYENADYQGVLTLARIGTLSFFLLGALLLFKTCLDEFDPATAIGAVGIYTCLPPIIAHSSVATTDMALTVFVFGATAAYIRWLRHRDGVRSLLLGLFVGLALISKMSALFFLPAIFVLTYLAFKSHRPAAGRKGLPAHLALAAAAAALVIWSGYGFSLHPLTTAADRPHQAIDRYISPGSAFSRAAYQVAEAEIFPAIEYAAGIKETFEFKSQSRPSYLLGEVYAAGHWAFYPVAVLFKTPLAVLLLSGIGVWGLIRRKPRHSWKLLSFLAAMTAVMTVCIYSRVNLGLRLVLPIYPFMAVLAGYGLVVLWQSRRFHRAARLTVVVMLAWFVVDSTQVHPDYLAYFNELSNGHPEEIIVDSDLDWGQDLNRLAASVRHHRFEHLHIAYNGTARIRRHGLPDAETLHPYQPVTGTIAVSLHTLKHEPGYAWLDCYRPVDTIGKSIRLYMIDSVETACVRQWRHQNVVKQSPSHPQCLARHTRRQPLPSPR